MVCRHRCDHWPVDTGRPEAVSEGTFEIGHARLVKLMATLCPTEVLTALQNPITSRLAKFSQPTGPQEKAELATVIEVITGLLAAAAPAAAAAAAATAGSSGGEGSGSSSSGSSGDWVLQALREGLVGSTLEMASPWGAGLWYSLDYLLSEMQQQQQYSSPLAAAAAAAAVPGSNEGMDVDDAALIEAGDAAAAAAQTTLQQILQIVLDTVPTTTRPAAAVKAAAAQGLAPVGLGGQGLGPAAAAATSTGDQKRLKYILSCLPSVRRLGTFDGGILSPQQQQQQGVAAVGEGRGQHNSSSSSWPQPQLPKAVRVFLARVMQEVGIMMEVEQPAAVREHLGCILADVAVLFSAPAPLTNGSSSSAPAAVIGGGLGVRGEGGSSGYSSPADVDLPSGGAAAAAAGGGGEDDGTAAVLLVNSSMLALKAQARQLLQKAVDGFLTHAALLEGLKNSGAVGGAGGSSSNLPAAAAAAVTQRGSDNSGSDADLVMVDAPVNPDTNTSSSPQTAAALARPPPSGLGSSSSSVPPELSASLHPCAIGLQLLHAAHVTGESASLRPLLVALLPGVLQLQELSGPGLQQLVGEAKAGFVQYKYLPLSERELSAVAHCVLSAGGSESWSTRAAAMVYLQIFWFRHCYSLDAVAMEQLQVGGLGGGGGSGVQEGQCFGR